MVVIVEVVVVVIVMIVMIGSSRGSRRVSRGGGSYEAGSDQVESGHVGLPKTGQEMYS